MSISSRWWRKDPFEWETREIETAPVGFVTLWNEDKLKINLDNGAVEYVKVQDLGDDPERLLRRGQDLLTREDFAKASEVLNLAIFIQPDLIAGYRQLAWVYSRQRNYDAAVRVLEDGIRQNPPVDIKPATFGSQDPRMWLWLELGRTYQEAGRWGDAERVFREFLKIDPTDWLAVEDLARLLLDRSREEETDRLLEQYFQAKSSGPDAARDIGGFYRMRNLFEKARRYYSLAYRGEHDGLVSRPYAEVLEKCGRYAEALAVLQKSREWMSSRDVFKDDLREVDVGIKRVLEKLSPTKP